MHYPLIGIKKKESAIYSWPNETKLHRASVDRLKFYEELLLIDSSGNQFLVRSAKSLGAAWPFWGFSLITLKQVVKVELDLKKLDSVLSVDELRRLVIEHIDSNRNYWLALDTFEEIKAKLTSKMSYIEIIQYFGPHR